MSANFVDCVKMCSGNIKVSVFVENIWLVVDILDSELNLLNSKLDQGLVSPQITAEAIWLPNFCTASKTTPSHKLPIYLLP